MAKEDKAEPKMTGGKKTCDAWKSEKGTADFFYAGARGMGNWPIGMELTEKEYDDAVAAFANVTLR